MALTTTYVKDIKIGTTALPGKEASLNLDGNQIDITNFITAGTNGVKNYLVGLLDVNITTSGNLSSIQGYKALLKKSGTPTTFSAEAASLVGTLTYQITDVTKRAIDPDTALVIWDGSSPVTPVSIDYLFGTVVLPSASGTITFHSGKYLPLTVIGQNSGSFELSLTGTVLDGTTRPAAISNGGLKVNLIGLIDSSANVDRMDDLTGDFKDLAQARTPFLLEFGLANGAFTARGWYTLKGAGSSGSVEGIEMEKLQFVPYGRATESFSYVYTNAFNAGLADAIDAFFARTLVTAHYLPDGTNGHSLDCYVAEFKLSGDMNTEQYSLKLVAADALEDEP